MIRSPRPFRLLSLAVLLGVALGVGAVSAEPRRRDDDRRAETPRREAAERRRDAPPPPMPRADGPRYAAPAYDGPPGPYSGRAENVRPDLSRPDPGRPDSLGADWRQQQYEVRRGVREGRIAPLGRVIDQIRSHSPGRQLDAGLEPGPGGRTVYRVRWATADGRRMDYIVDAESGRILGVDGR